MNGRSTSGTTGLGTVEVSGRSRVPSPPTRITACISASPSDALVYKPGGAHRVGVKRVAPVDTSVPAILSATAPQSSSLNCGHSVTSTTASAPATASSAEPANSNPGISLRASSSAIGS